MQQEQTAIEFSKWLINRIDSLDTKDSMVKFRINNGAYDLTLKEMYELWKNEISEPETDGAGFTELDNYIVSIKVDVNCTHYQAELGITYQELVNKLGEPVLTGNRFEGDKTQAEWWIEGYVDGVEKIVATIYDWKEIRSRENVTDWHIGGRNEDAIKLIKNIFPNKKITK